jgi:hypothetical protein
MMYLKKQPAFRPAVLRQEVAVIREAFNVLRLVETALATLRATSPRKRSHPC